MLDPVEVVGICSKDWHKLKAAIRALKNPIQKDSVVLDPSMGELAHVDNIRSQSTPNIPESTESFKLGMDSHFHRQSPIPLTADRATINLTSRNPHEFEEMRESESPNVWHKQASQNGIIFQSNMDKIYSRDAHSSKNSTGENLDSSKNMVSQWIAELDYGRSSVSHTEPAIPPDSVLRDDPLSTSSKVHLSPPPMPSPSQELVVDRSESNRSSSKMRLPGGQSVHNNDPRKALSTSSHYLTDMRSSPSTPLLSLPANTLVKIYMNKVQEGKGHSILLIKHQLR